MSDNGIAAGVPMYSRESALRQFLDSVPDYVEVVYVADNGPEQDRDCYHEDWPFELKVLHLEHDIGIGACRAAIADACDERYLWLGDCDMQILRYDDLRLLRSILDANPELGGVSGWLLEERAVRAGARNLHIQGDAAIKTVDDIPTPDGDPVPFATFDFIPQAGLFRTVIYDEYCYDPDMDSSEHFDFFFAHKQLNEWVFASTPAVLTVHNRNIDPEYRQKERGGNHVDESVLDQKWGISRIEPGPKTDWAQVRDLGLKADAFDLVKRTTPPAVWLRIKAAAKRVGIA